MARLVMFEIHAADPERAVKFYAQAFGWEFDNPAKDFYQLRSDSAVHGNIFRRRGPEPVDGQPLNAWTCTLQVDNLDAAIGSVQAAGGRVVVPKYPVPGFGWSAYFKDTEGNVVGLFEPDTAAK